MNKQIILHLVRLVGIALFLSCNTSTNQGETKLTWPLPSRQILQNYETLLLSDGVFNDEILTSGIIEAKNKIEIKFQKKGIISSLNFKIGETVRKGQVIASLNKEVDLEEIKKIQIKLQRAQLEYEDNLLKSGYNLADTIKLSHKVKEIAKIRSGFSTAQLEYTHAILELKKNDLVAPFTGKIANLAGKTYSETGPTDAFCTLINDEEVIINFKILEQEIAKIELGSKVQITPYTRQLNIEGSLIAINPQIDKSGMITLLALAKNPNITLADGMKVKIIIKRPTKNGLIIPKSAVVDRHGKKVVFTKKDSLAKWNYVEIEDESSTHYLVKTGLKLGDSVIITNNFNLSHNKVLR